MHELHKAAGSARAEGELIIEEALVAYARFGTQTVGEMQPLGLTLHLTSPRGLVIAFYTDVAQVLELLSDLGVERPEELQGRRVKAHFSARKLVGISA